MHVPIFDIEGCKKVRRGPQVAFFEEKSFQTAIYSYH